MLPTDQTKNKKKQRNARHHLANHRERLTCQMAESCSYKDFHTNKSSTISKRTAHPSGVEETMRIPIEGAIQGHSGPQ